VADAVIDASVWVSRLVHADAHHRASVAWFEAREAEGDLLLAPALMPPEVAGAISRRTGNAPLAWRAVRSLLRLPALRLAAIDSALSERAARLAADLALRGADAVYAALAQALGVPLATLDREQRERASRRVEVEWLGRGA
jgi:predicted nucleic acid-binding protein